MTIVHGLHVSSEIILFVEQPFKSRFRYNFTLCMMKSRILSKGNVVKQSPQVMVSGDLCLGVSACVSTWSASSGDCCGVTTVVSGEVCWGDLLGLKVYFSKQNIYGHWAYNLH